MNEVKAREILGAVINTDDSIGPSYGHYMSWSPKDDDKVTLDSQFTADELEAITWWMRNKIAKAREWWIVRHVRHHHDGFTRDQWFEGDKPVIWMHCKNAGCPIIHVREVIE